MVNLLDFDEFSSNTLPIRPDFEKYMRFPREWLFRPSFDVYIRCFLNEGIDYIREGIISTYPPETVIKYIKRKCMLDDDDIWPENKSIVVHENAISSHPEIKNILNMGGYYFSRTYNKMNVYEARYDERIVNFGHKKLYHVSPSIYENKIMSIGLTPKSKNLKFNYPDRIYLFEATDTQTVERTFHILCYMLSKPKYDNFKNRNGEMPDKQIESELSKIKNFTLFEIDIEPNLHGPDKINLFLDHNAPQGMSFYYITENIHPKYIKKLNTFKIEDFELNRIP